MSEECDLMLVALKIEEGTMNKGMCRATEAKMSSSQEHQKRMLVAQGLATEASVRHLPVEC